MNCLPQENRNSSLGQLRMKDFLVMGEFIIRVGQELICLSCYSGLEANYGGKESQIPEQAVFLMRKSWTVPPLFPAHTSARALSLSTEPIDSTDQFFQSQAARPMKNDFVAHHPAPPRHWLMQMEWFSFEEWLLSFSLSFCLPAEPSALLSLLSLQAGALPPSQPSLPQRGILKTPHIWVCAQALYSHGSSQMFLSDSSVISILKLEESQSKTIFLPRSVHANLNFHPITIILVTGAQAPTSSIMTYTIPWTINPRDTQLNAFQGTLPSLSHSFPIVTTFIQNLFILNLGACNSPSLEAPSPSPVLVGLNPCYTIESPGEFLENTSEETKD